MSWVTLLSKKLNRGSPYSASRMVSYLAIMGLSIGIATFLLTQGIFAGFEKTFFEKILGFHAHLMVDKWDPYASFDPEVRDLWGEFPDEVIASTPYLSKPSMLIYQGKIQGVILKGVERNTFDQVYDLSFQSWQNHQTYQKITDLILADSELPQIILGSDLAKELGVHSKDPIIRAYLSDSEAGQSKGRTQRFQVIGIFHTGFQEFDKGFALLDLQSLQGLFHTEDELSGYDFLLKNPFKAREVSQVLKEKLKKTPYYMMSWDELYAPLFTAIAMDRKVIFIVLVLVIAVAAFNIVGVLWLRLFEKRKEISILRAMGAQHFSIQKLFFLQGFKLTLFGVMGGFLLAALLYYLLKESSLFRLPKEVYLIETLPIYFSWEVALSVIGASFIVATLATWLGVHRLKKERLHL